MTNDTAVTGTIVQVSPSGWVYIAVDDNPWKVRYAQCSAAFLKTSRKGVLGHVFGMMRGPIIGDQVSGQLEEKGLEVPLPAPLYNSEQDRRCPYLEQVEIIPA